MRITFQLTASDYHHGLLAWRNVKAWRRWLHRCAYVLMSLTIPIAVVVAVLIHDRETLKIAAFVVGFAALWFAYMWAAPWLSARRQFRGSPSAQSPITIETTETGLALHSAVADSKVSWSAYAGWGESKSVFILLPQPRIYVTIPKRAFSGAEPSEFREILRRNIGMK